MRSFGLLSGCLLISGSAWAYPHGGLQQSLDIHFQTDGRAVVETTYGLLIQKDAGPWSWVCEEISGTESAWHFGMSDSDRWILSGVDQVAWSDDQCTWIDVGGDVQGLYITSIRPDPDENGQIWMVTASGSEENGLFRSQDDGQTFELTATFGEGARLRDLAIHDQDIFWVVGWRDELPWLWISNDLESWSEVELDSDCYSVAILGLNPEDHDQAWIKLVTADGDRLVKANLDGSTETVLEIPDSIESLVVLPGSGHVLMGGREAGLYRSTDSGQSWSGPHTTPEPGCLEVYEDDLYICGSNWTDAAAILRTPVSESDPDGWVWDPILNFGQVRQVEECDAGTLTHEICDPLWEVVVLEAGFDREVDTGSEDGGDSGDPQPDCGCSQGVENPSSTGLVFLIGWLGMRRRRDQEEDDR